MIQKTECKNGSKKLRQALFIKNLNNSKEIYHKTKMGVGFQIIKLEIAVVVLQKHKTV